MILSWFSKFCCMWHSAICPEIIAFGRRHALQRNVISSLVGFLVHLSGIVYFSFTRSICVLFAIFTAFSLLCSIVRVGVVLRDRAYYETDLSQVHPFAIALNIILNISFLSASVFELWIVILMCELMNNDVICFCVFESSIVIVFCSC